MPDLLVRNIDESLVRALKARAGAHGRSAEAEHRDILAQALGGPPRRSLAEILAAMPDVGLDSDFDRINPAPDASGGSTRVFD
jgi:plasmid stability protein